MKYKLTLYMSKFMKVGDEYQTVEVTNEFAFDWDTLVDFIGCLVDGSDKSHKFEIQPIKED